MPRRAAAAAAALAAAPCARGWVCNFSAGVAHHHGPRRPPEEQYTLLSTEMSDDGRTGRTYLMAHNGDVVHYWDSQFVSTGARMLLPGGALLRAGHAPGAGTEHLQMCQGAGGTGVIERIAWGGAREWAFHWSNASGCLHHDLVALPNGNVLASVFDIVDADAARALGFRRGNGLATTAVYEIRPAPPSGGEVVWEWHITDHLVQDTDPALPGYGRPGEHPGRFDVNIPGPGPPWAPEDAPYVSLNHLNGMDYNAALDQVILSFRFQSEVLIIDHSTTTAEARTGAGGRSGRGGRFLWRWGNPASYHRGGAADRVLDGQHNPHWVANDVAGSPPGRVLVFSNGWQLSEASAVVELDTPPPDPATGAYPLAHRTSTGDEAFGPAHPEWTYSDPPRFWSEIVSNAQRLTGGATFVNQGARCRLFEVAPRRGGRRDDVVWEFDATRVAKEKCFQAFRYAASGPALAGRSLNPIPGPC